MPLLNTVQFTCHVQEEGGRTAHFTVKRRKLEKFEQLGAKYIDDFVRADQLHQLDAAAAAMRGVRAMLDPATAPLPAMAAVARKMQALKSPDGPDYDEEQFAQSLNSTAAGTSIAALTIWYVYFRYRSNFFRLRPKLWQAIHVYFLDGVNEAAPEWPLIKIATAPYDFGKTMAELELPPLDRINVWLQA